MIFCETWLVKEETDFYHLDGYNAVFNCRNSQNRGGGTVIYVRDGWSYKTVYETEQHNIIILDILIDRQSNKRKKICVFYRKPTHDTMKDFVDEMDEVMTQFDDVILIGDANIDIFKDDHDTVY
jgi:hypothetical protein